MAASVLLIDDHPIVLFGLSLALEQRGEYVVCGKASDPERARALSAALAPSFIILDLVLGGRDGLEMIRDLASLAPGVRMLIYSSQSEAHYARRVLAAGAAGFVAKSEGLDVVVGALDVLARGEIFVSETLRSQLLDDFMGIEATAPDALAALSERERQVLRLIGRGHALRDIAAELDLSVKTVATYRDRLKVKLALDHARDLLIVARNIVEI